MFEDAHIAPLVRPLKASVTGDIGAGPVGAHGDRRRRALDRVRERRQSAARPSGGASAGARGPGGPRRRPRDTHSRAAGRKRDAQRVRWRCWASGLRTRRSGSCKAWRQPTFRVSTRSASMEVCCSSPSSSRSRPACCSARFPRSSMPVRISGRQLRAGGRSLSQSKERQRARSTLVVVQIALALVLLVSSGLMIRTFQALKHVPPGFSRAGARTDVAHLHSGIGGGRRRRGRPYRAADPRQDSRRFPESRRWASRPSFPWTATAGTIRSSSRITSLTDGQLPAIRLYKFISPGLLKTMGNQLVAGRDFTWAETYEKRPVVDGLGESGARAVARSCRGNRQAGARESEKHHGTRSSVWSATSAMTV